MAAGVHHQVASHGNGNGSAGRTSMSTSSVCLQIEPSERTPLLTKKVTFAEDTKSPYRSCLLDFKVLVIGLLSVSAIAIAVYLLIVDSRFPQVRFAFDLVTHDAWSAIPYTYMGTKLLTPSNIMHLLFVQTGGSECYDLESCTRLLREMEVSQRSKMSDIPYNFMIGGDGQIYEGKGWLHLSGFQLVPQWTSLVVGFLGNFTENQPTEEQLDAGKALIQEALNRRKLLPTFHLFGLQNLTVSHEDGLALYEEISQWPNFDTILKVL